MKATTIREIVDSVKQPTIKEWIDNIIKRQKYLIKNQDFSLDIQLCGVNNGIHVYNGIHEIAKELGVELKFDGTRYSFYYKGIEVYQLEGNYYG